MKELRQNSPTKYISTTSLHTFFCLIYMKTGSSKLILGTYMVMKTMRLFVKLKPD